MEMDAADLVRSESDESIAGGGGERRPRAELPRAGLRTTGETADLPRAGLFTTGETAGGSTLVRCLDRLPPRPLMC